MTADDYSDEEIGGLGSGPRYSDGPTAEQLRFLRIAEQADRIATDAERDPGMYPDPAEGFRWAAEQIRAAIKETQ